MILDELRDDTPRIVTAAVVGAAVCLQLFVGTRDADFSTAFAGYLMLLVLGLFGRVGLIVMRHARQWLRRFIAGILVTACAALGLALVLTWPSTW